MCAKPPIAADCCPHDSSEPKFLLDLPQTEPTGAVGGAKQSALPASAVGYGLLALFHFAPDGFKGLQIEARVVFGVVSYLVTGSGHTAPDLRHATEIRPALEKNPACVVLL